MRLSVYLCAVLAALAIAGCAHAPTQDAAAETATDPKSDIDALIRHRVDAKRMATGVVIGVIRPDGVSYHAYGTTEKDGGRPVDENTIYDVGSLTKIFTALLLAKRAESGELRIDDPIANHLPAGRRAPLYDGEPIRIVDLATHTSGLPLRPPNLASDDPENPYAGYTKELMYDALAGHELSAKPGSAFQYSNLAYGLLGDMVASSAGADYATLLQEQILAPFGMNDTSLTRDPAKQARSAQGHDAGLEPVKRWDMGALKPAGGISATAADIVAFLRFFLAPPTPQAEAEINRMVSVARPADYPNTEIALGWRVTKDHGETVIWSNGNVGGFRAFMGYNPEKRIGAVALANAVTARGVDDIGLHILDPQAPVDMKIPVKRQEVTLSAAQIDRVVGAYRGEDDGDIVTIRRDGDKIYYGMSGGEIEIFAEAPDSFFFKVVDAQLIFHLPDDGGIASGFTLHDDDAYAYTRIDD